MTDWAVSTPSSPAHRRMQRMECCNANFAPWFITFYDGGMRLVGLQRNGDGLIQSSYLQGDWGSERRQLILISSKEVYLLIVTLNNYSILTRTTHMYGECSSKLSQDHQGGPRFQPNQEIIIVRLSHSLLLYSIWRQLCDDAWLQICWTLGHCCCWAVESPISIPRSGTERSLNCDNVISFFSRVLRIACVVFKRHHGVWHILVFGYYP